jgi:glycosyltransferase involved in cell wall biosynthesis
MPSDIIVSFVVPCYRLAHYLAECVESIVQQSYQNIEIIIINDCSPDNTEEVSRSVKAKHPDKCIRYVVNVENLGNIRTYNSGIRIATGQFVWILSPDDRLRSPDVVKKYVGAMRADPDIGFAFCPGHTINGSVDVGPRHSSQYRNEDSILEGRQLALDIISNNFELLAPSVLVRKKCYEDIADFPVDLPHRGDCYVWSLFALKHKVAFFAEPMVDYRIHDSSMMTTLSREALVKIMLDDVGFPLLTKAHAKRQRLAQIVRHCRAIAIQSYARSLVKVTCRGYSGRMSLLQFEASLLKFEADRRERLLIRAGVLRAVARMAISPKRGFNLFRRMAGGAAVARTEVDSPA